ncbi:TlpA family protein disulfide reductase [Sansalvadorimonas verongulae]|uniref:TlpA family protein disulfide reductase n=1 Tax=Sansalvadorimonas verongulae TaxID=2172824 RepID=UPI0012BC260B|nr:TlpA disulfide reductase family protein [Sansalvadorimonas verongulae]MTI14771.1 TlpA family protein disulfide reductase [Sansalvadorimonas verongulae]
MKLKPYVLSVLLSCVVFVTGCSKEPELADFRGNPLTLENKQGDWLVVNYWAIWCDPCREEVPDLNELGKADNGIQVWGVDFDGTESRTELALKIAMLDIEFPVVAADKVGMLKLERPPVLPATYILNSDGVMQDRLLGPQTKERLEQHIAKLQAQ